MERSERTELHSEGVNQRVEARISQQWQLPGRPAQIVSRLRPSMKLAEHFVHGVDDRLRLIQLNLVT
jgi:hypothetical protein